MAEKEPEVKSILALIPSVYYDLIARVAPGMCLIALVIWQYRVPINVEKWGSLLSIVVLLVGSYVVGMVITPFSWVWDLPGVLIARQLLEKQGKWPWDIWSEVTGKMDAIGIISREAGATLAKMMAETVLCENLFTVALFTMWMGPLRMPSDDWPKLTTCPWLFLSSLLAVGMVCRQWAFVARLKSFEIPGVAS